MCKETDWRPNNHGFKIDCEYLLAVEQQKLSRCPHIIRKLAGDETYDLCELNSKGCLIEHGIYECEIWDEIQKEWLEEHRRVKDGNKSSNKEAT